jgi:hypothetical protein
LLRRSNLGQGAQPRLLLLLQLRKHRTAAFLHAGQLLLPEPLLAMLLLLACNRDVIYTGMPSALPRQPL